jgi:hypothetical protein
MIGEGTARPCSLDFIDEFKEDHIIITADCRGVDTWPARIA